MSTHSGTSDNMKIHTVLINVPVHVSSELKATKALKKGVNPLKTWSRGRGLKSIKTAKMKKKSYIKVLY